MQLIEQVLAQKKWNSDTNAFGRSDGHESSVVGPSSVAYAHGKTYLLDTVHSRIMVYDQSGLLLSTVTMPTTAGSDLSFDPADSSLLVIDHLQNKIYKVSDNQVTLMGATQLKENYPLGTKFAYDGEAGELVAEDVDQSGLTEIQGKNLILWTGKEPVTIAFDQSIACVEQVTTDPQGMVWVLYTLEGDYRIRRLARVDAAHGTVGVAEIDVWFPFDATRHMAATENGVVIFAGDKEEGRLLAFNYPAAKF